MIRLSNTSKGSQWSAALTVERPVRGGSFASASYLYGRATSVNDATASIAAPNWANTYTQSDVNAPPLTRSNYDVGHRVTATAAVPFPIGPRTRGLASIYYNGQSGQPYVLVFQGDANGDTRFNDIVFVPSTSDQVVVRGGVGNNSTRISRSTRARAATGVGFRRAMRGARRLPTPSTRALRCTCRLLAGLASS